MGFVVAEDQEFVLPPLEDRPLVTFALFAYNQEKYIREAVEGAFAQTYEPLEIILSDDCSTDRTFEIMEELTRSYSGPHTVRVRKNNHNLGLVQHVNAVFSELNGKIVVMAAGDDISYPNRCSISVKLLQNFPKAAEALLSSHLIDANGLVTGIRSNTVDQPRIQQLDDLFKWKHVVFGAARAIRREVFSEFGPLSPSCPTEDTPLLIRSLLVGGSVLSPDVALKYRLHISNLSSAASLKQLSVSAIHKQYLTDLARAHDLKLSTIKIKNRFSKWINEDRLTRDLYLKIALNSNIQPKDFLKAIQLPAFDIRTKLALALKAFRQKSNKTTKALVAPKNAPSPDRVLLQGYYGFGNFGDDLLMIAGERIVREKYPNSTISIFANFSPNLSEYNQTPEYRLYINKLLTKTPQVIDWTARESFDLVLHCGGGVFFDYKNGGLLHYSINKIIYLLGVKKYSSALSALRSLLKKPSRLSAARRVGIGLGVGPYHPASQRLSHEAEILGSFDKIAVRDLGSFATLRKLRTEENSCSFSDLIFEPKYWLPPNLVPIDNRNAVAIILCQGKAGNEAIFSAEKSNELLKECEHLYIFLDENHDCEMWRDAQSRGLNVVVWRPAEITLSAFLATIQNCSLIITNRAHGAIVGATLGIPSIILKTDRKLESVHEMIPDGTILHDPNKPISELNQTANLMLDNLEDYKSRLQENLKLNQEKVRAMIDYAFS